ncbi:MAG: crotonobetainyl-CoA:carnitine CoA-transferase CaiB-like acyl-CoA transferase [Sulfitobacter sp.]|jgi:crotonobetainyl-CoA:carnitine CoA-transferase CaiB-like acyl-CoA transferase
MRNLSSSGIPVDDTCAFPKPCDDLGLGHLLEDVRLQSRMDQINARDWTLPLIAEIVASRPYDEMLQIMEDNDLLFAPVSRPAEMYDDPHVNRPGGLFTSHYSDKKDFRAPALPVELNGRPIVSDNVDVPSVGAHNAEILGALKVEAAE